jgi:hypothetical protein
MCSWLRLLSPGPFSAAARFEPGPVVAISLRPRAKERPCLLPNAGPLTKQCPSEGCVCVCAARGRLWGSLTGGRLFSGAFCRSLQPPLPKPPAQVMRSCFSHVHVILQRQGGLNRNIHVFSAGVESCRRWTHCRPRDPSPAYSGGDVRPSIPHAPPSFWGTAPATPRGRAQAVGRRSGRPARATFS